MYMYVCVCMYIYVYMLYTQILSEHFYLVFFTLIKSSAAVAYPLRSLMHCVFRDALLYSTVVM